jgi:hypothetical protein
MINAFLSLIIKARQEKANLEASMEARAKSFQSTLSKLQINQWSVYKWWTKFLFCIYDT